MSHSNSANRVKLDTACSHSFAAYPLDGTVVKSQKSIFFALFPAGSDEGFFLSVAWLPPDLWIVFLIGWVNAFPSSCLDTHVSQTSPSGRISSAALSQPCVSLPILLEEILLFCL